MGLFIFCLWARLASILFWMFMQLQNLKVTPDMVCQVMQKTAFALSHVGCTYLHERTVVFACVNVQLVMCRPLTFNYSMVMDRWTLQVV